MIILTNTATFDLKNATVFPYDVDMEEDKIIIWLKTVETICITVDCPYSRFIALMRQAEEKNKNILILTDYDSDILDQSFNLK